jgi:hypothetical protein
VICRAAPLGCDVDTTDDENYGIVGKRRGQRLNAMNVDADGGADGARGADVADVEGDRSLLEVGAAEHLDRTAEIEKRNARRKDNHNRNLAFGRRRLGSGVGPGAVVAGPLIPGVHRGNLQAPLYARQMPDKRNAEAMEGTEKDMIDGIARGQKRTFYKPRPARPG